MSGAPHSRPEAGGAVHHRRFWNLPALTLALTMAAAAPSLADTAAPAAAVTTAAAQDTTIAPMPDAARPGAYCLAGATAAMVAAFAAGPSESLMILSGAMHLPSTTSVLFIPLMSILGGGACAIGAAAQPAISWAIEQSDTIGAQVTAATDSLLRAPAGPAPAGKDTKATEVRALTEGETQSVGCIAGALVGFGAAMATSPMEVAMLSSGANTVVSTSPILALGLIGTIVASGCAIGTYAILPIEAFFNNFSAIGDSVVSSLSQIGNMVSAVASRPMAAATGASPAVEVADGAAAR